jgi:DNA-binding transcriptional LysR family regulator
MMMGGKALNIDHLKYFITVVNNGFNLSEASKKLHISQPALSKYILKFEEEEKVDLFYRKHGRLQGLTPSGENFFANAKGVVEAHDRMLKELRETSKKVRGVVRIGIPPLILTVLFTEVLSRLILLNPLIKFEIVEAGAFELRKLLAMNELDFAVLLSPSDLNPQAFQEVLLKKDDLTVFLSSRHPLAEKEVLKWSDLQNEKLALFNETFMIHHLLMGKFRALRIEPDIQILSGSWDFLLEVTKDSEMVTILPSPITKFIPTDGILEKKILSPVSWKVVLTHPLKSYTSSLEKYVKDSIIDYFHKEKEIEPINREEEESTGS